jgi:hypothetical protein
VKKIQNKPPEKPKRPRGNPNWKKGGPSPNPGGRPKEEREVVEILRLKGRELAEKLLEVALEDGNVKAIAEAFNRAYGKPKETVEFSGTVKREIDFENLPPARAEKVAALLEQIEALLRADG